MNITLPQHYILEERILRAGTACIVFGILFTAITFLLATLSLLTLSELSASSKAILIIIGVGIIPAGAGMTLIALGNKIRNFTTYKVRSHLVAAAFIGWVLLLFSIGLGAITGAAIGVPFLIIFLIFAHIGISAVDKMKVAAEQTPT